MLSCGDYQCPNSPFSCKILTKRDANKADLQTLTTCKDSKGKITQWNDTVKNPKPNQKSPYNMLTEADINGNTNNRITG